MRKVLICYVLNVYDAEYVRTISKYFLENKAFQLESTGQTN